MNGDLLVSCSNEERGQPYLDALRAVGVAAERLRLLLCGGPDLEPHHYGETPHPHANLGLMPERDAVELELLAGARAARTPLLGVCRGLQMTNAFLGGTLWQDLGLMWPNAVLHNLSFPRDALIHTIEVTPGRSGLSELLGREPTLVNSRHHQAIKELAPGLEPVAVAPDGIVEAIAGCDPQWWLWGVQWHPENLISLPAQRELFTRFHEQAEARARQLEERRQEPALR